MATLSKRMIEITSSMGYAEDVKQEFYLWHLENGANDIYRNKSEEEIKAYILRVLMSIRNSQHQKDKRRLELDHEQKSRIMDNIGFSANQSHHCPADEVLAEQEYEQRLQELSPLLRETLEAYTTEGLSYSEIAEREGDKIEAVRKRVVRAQQQLRGTKQ